MTGLSAIDMALWDIEAKRLGVPLYSLLGGPIQNNLRVYFTHWDASIPAGKRDIAAVTELAARTREQGWTAVKYTLPLAATELERIDKDVAELAAIRQVFGTQVDIALECAETFTVRSAIQFANDRAVSSTLHGGADTPRKPGRPWGSGGKEPGPHCHG
jgi:galactonate dehydratase